MSAVGSYRSPLQVIRAYCELTKPKILLMLAFTSFSAALVATHGSVDFAKLLFMFIGTALSSGGAAAINMWYDRDIDAVMERTQGRPIPRGMIDPEKAFRFGLLLGVLSFVVLYVLVNPLTAWLGLAGYIYYAVIYTVWLKRRTPQNIVIGGGAGAMPVLIGWAAVTGTLSLAPILMFLIIFFWTPPHSWALALYKNAEYTKALVPMMPVVKGPRSTKRQSVVYTVLLFATSIALYFTHAVGALYLVIAVPMNVVFLYATIKMHQEADDTFVWAKRTFFWSLVYILVVFTAMMIGM
ncbi:protoheme IX farnesyltransferase [Tumebacillus flagellatus]|uniref:Protoheme IX farnesyltransferase n=2 Tax=Tumebacillus flagellatus TaxID=1157490 RepID=A0A074LT21_9BACL|nr:protoheme IX farnesyltransferase [Tumebacillus flagellatus]